jgi:FlaA1/EpsC-like NDP-sugar epimerase
MRRILPSQNMVAILHDSAMAALSFAVALYLRLAEDTIPHTRDYLYPGMAAFTLILLGFMLYFRTYRRVWRYTSLNDLLAIAKAGSFALVVFYFGMFAITRLEMLPRSVPFIHWMTLMVFLTGGRVLWRLLNDRWLYERVMGRSGHKVPVLLVGATAEAETFIRETTRNPQFPYRVAGLIDDDDRKHGREIHGARIYGSSEELAYILRKLARKGRMPQRLVLSDANFNSKKLEAMLEVAESFSLTLSRLPRLSELQRDGEYDIRPVAVEDILGRAQTVLDRSAMEQFVCGKRVLITGAGGSIGSELVRQVAQYAPAHLVLYELCEFNLYEIDRELQNQHPDLPRTAIIGDVRDAVQFSRCMQQFQPEIVFHAAAIKHVPLSESNPDQAVLTNVLGSKIVADACVQHAVAAMVQISTDKAVNPTSVMGASKRVAEIYTQTLGQDGCATRFITVRFGNVLGSAGSVVPLFQEQLAKGGPITVTHPEMIRYFMTIREAVQLVLQSALQGMEVADHAPIYVLDMGEPIKILDLALQMIRLAGLRPNIDIPITFTGLRPGEKLFEELFHDAENFMETPHASIRQARARSVDRLLTLSAIARLVDAARAADSHAIRACLLALVPESQLGTTESTHEAA